MSNNDKNASTCMQSFLLQNADPVIEQTSQWENLPKLQTSRKLAEIADFLGYYFLKMNGSKITKFLIQENALYCKYKDYKSGMRIQHHFLWIKIRHPLPTGINLLNGFCEYTHPRACMIFFPLPELLQND